MTNYYYTGSDNTTDNKVLIDLDISTIEEYVFIIIILYSTIINPMLFVVV